MSSTRVLYWGSGSTPCWRVMLVLAEKGLAYDSKKIQFDKKEHKSKEITDINPRGQVPTFKDGDKTVNESGAICDYLEQTYKNEVTQLVPSDSSKSYIVLQRKYEAQNLETKLMTNLLYYYWQNKDNLDQAKVAEKEEALREELKIWDGYLEGKKYIAGNDFTMADVFLFPLVAWAFRLGLKDGRYNNITNYYKTCCERSSVKDTWPPHWKESPSNMDICKTL